MGEFVSQFSSVLLYCGLAAMSLWELSCLNASIAPLFIKLSANSLDWPMCELVCISMSLCGAVFMCALSSSPQLSVEVHRNLWTNIIFALAWRAEMKIISAWMEDSWTLFSLRLYSVSLVWVAVSSNLTTVSFDAAPSEFLLLLFGGWNKSALFPQLNKIKILCMPETGFSWLILSQLDIMTNCTA